MPGAFQDTRSGARALGLTLKSVEVSHPAQLESAFSALARERPDALMVTGDSMLQLHVGRVVDFTAKHRLPAVYQIYGSVPIEV